MMALSLWSALSPSSDFPRSPFGVTINKVDYQLPLPAGVAEEICKVVRLLDSSIHRINDYCSESGLGEIRDEPSLLGMAADGERAYAEAELKLVGLDSASESGSVTKRVIVSSSAAEFLLRMAHKRAVIEQRARKFLIRHAEFLRESGGFEVMTALYFFDDEESAEVKTGLDDDEPAERTELLEVGKRKTRFTDFALRS